MTPRTTSAPSEANVDPNATCFTNFPTQVEYRNAA
jgi:hypothetical protein